jgi:isocitrate dehydrogenase
MLIFRENTEYIYTGIEFEAATEEKQKFLDFMEKEFPDKFAKIRFGNIGKVNEFLKLAGREEENELQLGIGVKVISKTGSERLMTAAIDYAIKNGRTKITIVHKGNIMKYTSG